MSELYHCVNAQGQKFVLPFQCFELLKDCDLYNLESSCLNLGQISFNNKLTTEILEAIEQEVINYELAEMINRGELK